MPLQAREGPLETPWRKSLWGVFALLLKRYAALRISTRSHAVNASCPHSVQETPMPYPKNHWQSGMAEGGRKSRKGEEGGREVFPSPFVSLRLPSPFLESVADTH